MDQQIEVRGSVESSFVSSASIPSCDVVSVRSKGASKRVLQQLPLAAACVFASLNTVNGENQSRLRTIPRKVYLSFLLILPDFTRPSIPVQGYAVA